MADVERFVDAQDRDGAYEAALAEIRAGRKRGHWIWFVLPQVAGLGSSAMSQAYAIRDREEAAAYLAHPVLRRRLLDITAEVYAHLARGVPIAHLMGSSLDAGKLVSSLTLFGRMAAERDEPESVALADLATVVLQSAQEQGYDVCRHTLDLLRST